MESFMIFPQNFLALNKGIFKIESRTLVSYIFFFFLFFSISICLFFLVLAFSYKINN